MTFVGSRQLLRFRTLRLVVLTTVCFAVISMIGCQISLVSFNLPPTVLAGATFDVTVSGQPVIGATALQSDSAGVVLQVPNDFTVIEAVAGFGSQLYNFTRDLPALLAIYTAQPGNYLASFSAAPGTQTPASIRIRVRAPMTTGTRQLKVSLASTTAGPWSANVPAGVTNFGSINAQNVSKSVSVIAGPTGAPVWQLASSGLPGTVPSVFVNVTPPFDVDVADFDQDGRMDLLSGRATVGVGTFIPFTARGQFVEGWAPGLPTGGLAGRSRFADFNGDGRPDVVIGRDVFLGTPGGVFFSTATLPLPPGLVGTTTLNVGLAVGDVDGDGFDDVAVSEGQTEIFMSRGNGSFMPANVGLPAVQTQLGIGFLDLVDLDGDGDRDLLIGGSSAPLTGSIIDMYLNDGMGNWTGIGSGGTNPPNTTRINAIHVVDLDGDSLPELIISRTDPGLGTTLGTGITIARSIAPGSWTAFNDTVVAPTETFTSFATEDIDGDGVLDLIAAQSTRNPSSQGAVFGRLRVFQGNASGGFTNSGTLESGLVPESFQTTGRVILRDVNGDGLNDIVLATSAGVSVYARVGPLHSSMSGNLGATIPGGPFATLGVNGSSGDPGTRAVSIGLGQPITISMAQSPTNPIPSRFILWGRLDMPAAAEAFPSVIGTFPFTPHLVDPSNPFLFTLADSFVPTDPLAILPSTSPGPFTFTLPAGLPFPFRFSLEAMIDDPSATGLPLARTNVVYVDVL